MADYTNKEEWMRAYIEKHKDVLPLPKDIKDMFVPGKKRALITGVTGQDGAYLSEFLLKAGYEVHGIKRRSSSFNTGRIDHIFGNPDFHLYHGDLSDSGNIYSIMARVRPDEVYNLGAMSHVQVSFEMPEYTGDVDGLGTLRVLDAMRSLVPNARFYQASTSELYGKVVETPQTEDTPFYPRSPYGVAKLYGYWITKNYREAYGMHASNGILFNHESPIRGETFLTRKVTRAAARASWHEDFVLRIGNLDAVRDWGHAKDYVEGMWLMLQQDEPDDYVLATGVQTTVREWITMAYEIVDIHLSWINEGLDEIALDQHNNVRVQVDERYFRPSEVELLVGDASKAKRKLGWFPKHDVRSLCLEMVEHDLDEYDKEE